MNASPSSEPSPHLSPPLNVHRAVVNSRMRIAIVNWSRRKVGGVETYLDTIVSELADTGHEIGFWHESDVPVERAQIALPVQSPAWCADEMGSAGALRALRDWRPDVIYTHKVLDPELEREIMEIAPSVFFAHDYNGTCISGSKTFRFPVVQPCSRRFGWQCLVHYFPHRCGGLSPVTMFKLYGLQSKRLANLHRYDAIVTHSDHMLSELIRHGLSPQRAYRFPYYVQSTKATEPPIQLSQPAITEAEDGAKVSARAGQSNWHLLFSGRMEHLKGGHVLIDALPQVAASLSMPVRVTFAGDGRERKSWERRASQLQNGKLSIEFTGWTERRQIDSLLEACDLLVVPSLWPEPFGLVGPEAGLRGVPVAAFAVGGIPDWLKDGINGRLAPGNPPTAEGLARAIVACLQNPTAHEQLRRGALEMSRQFNIKNHLKALLEVFNKVTASEDAPASGESPFVRPPVANRLQ
jgi:glycosyltransferase involved in cell wall biosynthesis